MRRGGGGAHCWWAPLCLGLIGHAVQLLSHGPQGSDGGVAILNDHVQLEAVVLTPEQRLLVLVLAHVL